MKNFNLKNIAISSLLAVSTCFAMVGTANAAQKVVVVKDKYQPKQAVVVKNKSKAKKVVVAKAKPKAKQVVVAKAKTPTKKVVVVR